MSWGCTGLISDIPGFEDAVRILNTLAATVDAIKTSFDKDADGTSAELTSLAESPKAVTKE